MVKFSFGNLSELVTSLPDSIKKTKLSILIPYYNEEQIIVDSIHTVLQKTTSWEWNVELVVSDDGSTDEGWALLQEQFLHHPQVILVRSPRNYGKGRALSTAFEYSTGDYVLFLDCDLELPIEHLPYFVHCMLDTNSDIVIGSKEDPASDLEYPLMRKLMSRVYALINKTLFRLSVKDTQTGIKLFKRDVLEQTLPYLLVKKFAFDIELLALCQDKGFKIVSHPIVLQYTRTEALGRMSLDTIIHMFKDTLAVWWRLKTHFWEGLVFGKADLSYAVISYNSEDSSLQDHFVIEDLEELNDLMPQISGYDALIFKKKGDEFPVFFEKALNRTFSNPHVQGILPLLYPETASPQEQLYYTIIGSLFFFRGYYPRYRPVRETLINDIPPRVLFATDSFIFRTSFLQELIVHHQGKCPKKIDDLHRIVHSPYCFIHKHFPETLSEFHIFLKTVTHKALGIKKTIRKIYLFTVLLLMIAILSEMYKLAIPWIVLEFGIYLWYIYSLGIRKGIRYIFLYNAVRVSLLISFFRNIMSLTPFHRFFKKGK